jgi:3-dehydroquinate synthase
MRRIHVNLGPKSYDIVIKRGILNRIGKRVREIVPQAERAAVVTDDRVNYLYGDMVEENLTEFGFHVHRIVVPHGESSKSMGMLSYVYGELTKMKITRSDVLITLSGGVPGDLGGFAAATYMRGIPFIQIPTTILAQVDSSVGGKVAVDLPGGKNLAGSFYQPRGVIIDPDVTRTLEPRFFHDGLAEAVKYGCIGDEDLFALFESFKSDEDVEAHLPEIIGRSCQMKASLVEEDEHDQGVRMLLNFGHTLAHGLEGYYEYQTITHGEAVAVGMATITRNTERMGYTRPGTAERIEHVLEKLHLPVKTDVPTSKLIPFIAHDKKRRGDQISIIILEDIGKSRILPVSLDALDDFLDTGA